jgi:SAM-dependent methyltransferase
MKDQVDYYDAFAAQHMESILGSADPAVWTSDMGTQGPTWQSMTRRVAAQTKLMEGYFHPGEEVLDLGCGFGRQSLVVARRGYPVLGIDSSPGFIRLAEKLFAREGLQGSFRAASILEDAITPRRRNILLLDVLEHLPPALRGAFVRRMRVFGSKGARCIVSLPWATGWRAVRENWRRRRGRSGDHEHPFVLPSPRVVRGLFREGFKELHHHMELPNMFFVFEITEEA